MKTWRVIVGCILAVALCAPAAFAGTDNTWGVGARFDWREMDLAYDDYKANIPVPTGTYAQLDRYQYKETKHSIWLVGSWNINEYFALEGLLGFGDYKLRNTYEGTQVGYDDSQFSDDFDDLIYGINAHARAPITENWFVGLALMGRLEYHREGTMIGTFPVNTSRVDSDVETWSLEVFPKVGYNIKGVDLYAGPTYNMVRSELEVKTYLTNIRVSETLSLKEDKPWGIRVGLNVPISDNFVGVAEGYFLSATGGMFGFSYTW